MWIVTAEGFLSVVEDGQVPGHVLVRARDRGDIERIAARLDDAPVRATPQRDYAFRVSVPREEWAEVLADLAREVDYPNFKAEVERRRGHARARTYAEVWSTLLSLQR